MSLILKNSIYNIFGFTIPLVVAVFTIPPLMKGLGEERFGILLLALTISGYFSLLDFGLSRATTKFIAEALGNNDSEAVPKIFWTSIFTTVVLSCGIVVILVVSLPFIITNVLKISVQLQTETLVAYYILIATVPFITFSACTRGLLEAYHQFPLINIFRVVLGVATFLIPYVLISYSKNLKWIMVAILVVRIMIAMLYLHTSFRINPLLKGSRVFNYEIAKRMFVISGWMAATSIVVPLNMYVDRFLLGSIISVAAVTYYVTPYEVITKLTIIPNALANVLFPTVAKYYRTNEDYVYKIKRLSLIGIYLFLFPIVLFLVLYADEILSLWISKDFAAQSYRIFQFLAVGVLFNSIGYIPFTFLDGIGRPDLNAKIQIFELPTYCFLIWGLIMLYGVPGVAIAFAVRTCIDSILLIGVSMSISRGSIFSKKDIIKIGVLSIVLLLIIVGYQSFCICIGYKILLFGCILGFFFLFMRKEILYWFTEQFVYQTFNRAR